MYPQNPAYPQLPPGQATPQVLIHPAVLADGAAPKARITVPRWVVIWAFIVLAAMTAAVGASVIVAASEYGTAQDAQSTASALAGQVNSLHQQMDKLAAADTSRYDGLATRVSTVTAQLGVLPKYTEGCVGDFTGPTGSPGAFTIPCTPGG